MSTFAVTDESSTLGAINYLLSNLGQGGTGNANVTIPGNVLVANTTTGIINNYGNTSNAAPYWFRYQYINLRYGNSATGTGFSTVPTNSDYFGVYNSITTTASGNPTDYTWTQVAGGFGTTKTIYYSAIGGRQVVWVAANSAPSSSFVVSVANVAINLDTVTTAAGTPGQRGPIGMAYVVTTSDPNFATSSTLSSWFAADPNGTAGAPPYGTGLTPVSGDIATFTYSAGVGTPSVTYTYNGSIWVSAYAQRVDGNVVIQNTLSANAIIAGSITSTQIAADSIYGNRISGNTITGNNLVIGTITGNLIANNTLTFTQIANGTITTNQIAANTITGNNIAAGTITANNLAANTLTANTVVSTGANIGNNSSIGFWLQGNTGNARFGSSINIGNLLTVGGNANIGANLNVGSNAIIGGNLVIGNNASIGGGLTVVGLITSGALTTNTVTTTNIISQAISVGDGYNNNGSNVQVFSNTSANSYSYLGNVNANPSAKIVFNNNLANNAIYLWASGTLSKATWTSSGSGNIIFTARLVKVGSNSPSSPQEISAIQLSVTTTAGTNTYLATNAYGGSSPQFVWPGYYDTTSTLDYTSSYYLDIAWRSSGPTITFMNAYSLQSTIMGQMLKR